MSVKPIPEGYHTITPYLTVNDGKAALDFYHRAFGAVILLNMPGSDGRLMHAEFKIGDSIVMMSDEFPEMGARSPKSLGGRSSGLMLYVEDVDAFIAKAVAAGATLVRPIANQFYGDRSGGLEDPFGHSWNIATHVEDVSDEGNSAQDGCDAIGPRGLGVARAMVRCRPCDAREALAECYVRPSRLVRRRIAG